jgi:DNA-binding IclR family transcriptional regulator
VEKTLAKGLTLLEALARLGHPVGVTEAAKAVGLQKSNAHRLLRSLADLGYVRQVADTGRYELTLKLWELGSRVIARLDIATEATPAMRKLAALTKETVHLSLLDGDEVVYVHKIDSPHPVRAYSAIGGRAPAHCVATGKALLAFQPPDAVDLSRARKAFSDATITAPPDLRRELERIRKAGYAINRGEWREGVFGVAAPILDANGRAVAAIGLSGPQDRFRPKAMKAFTPLVMAAARDVSRA